MFPAVDSIPATLTTLALRVRSVDPLSALRGIGDDPARGSAQGAQTQSTSPALGSATSEAGDAASSGVAPDHAAAQITAPRSPASQIALQREARLAALNPLVAHAATASDPLQATAQRDTVQLGSLARAIAAALPQAGTLPPAVPLSLAASPVTAPTAFAKALENAVRTSGASYESHLRDWVEGRQPIDSVRFEARVLMPLNPMAGSPAQVGTNGPAATAADASAASPLPQSFVADGAVGMSKPDGVTAAQVRFVESGEMRFALEPWPGQQAQLLLQVPTHPQDRPRPDAVAAASPGASVLTLTLPHLGQLEAHIRTEGTDVRITLATSSENSAGMLRDATAALASGMGLAGLKLISTHVHERPA